MKELDQFTVERLEEIRNSFLDQIQEKAPSIEEVFALIDIALSAKQAEPVAYMTYKGHLIHAGDPKLSEYSEPQPLYDNPQVNPLIVPEGWINTINGYLDNDGSRGVYDATGARAYRAKLEQLLAAAPTSLLEGE